MQNRSQNQNKAGNKFETSSHACMVCGKSFKKADQLSIHMNIHKEENNTYKCGFCAKSFREFKDFEVIDRSVMVSTVSDDRQFT